MFKEIKFKTLTIMSYTLIMLLKSAEMNGRDVMVQSSLCKSHKNCSSCIKLPECDWCHQTGCTDEASAKCPKKPQLAHLQNAGTSKVCSSIIEQGPILIPANVKRDIKIQVEISDSTILKETISCKINLEDQIIDVPGNINEYHITCREVFFNITKNMAVGYIKINWGGAEPNSNPINIIVYDCNIAKSCKECHKLGAVFQCGWCKNTMACTLEEKCAKKVSFPVPQWHSPCRAAPVPLIRYHGYGAYNSTPNYIFRNRRIEYVTGLVFL